MLVDDSDCQVVGVELRGFLFFGKLGHLFEAAVRFIFDFEASAQSYLFESVVAVYIQAEIDDSFLY